MIPNHQQFIEAIPSRRHLHITYYSAPDSGTIDRDCIPLDYGPGTNSALALNRYWVWDAAIPEHLNPLALVSDQIVKVQVLGKEFLPESLPPKARMEWSIPREWVPGEKAKSTVVQNRYPEHFTKEREDRHQSRREERFGDAKEYPEGIST